MREGIHERPPKVPVYSFFYTIYSYYGRRVYPEQLRTGRRGYLGKRGSDCESSHSRNTEPRSETIRRA